MSQQVGPAILFLKVVVNLVKSEADYEAAPEKIECLMHAELRAHDVPTS
jgi:hypothetical protein